MTQIEIPTGPLDSALALTTFVGHSAQARWRTEAMRSHASAHLLIIDHGKGRLTMRGMTQDYDANDLIFLPARTFYGFEAGPDVSGQRLTLPRPMAADWPQEPLHLRLRDPAAQKEVRNLLYDLEKELTLVRPLARRAAHYHAGLLSILFHRQALAQRPAEDRAKAATARIVAAFTELVERDFGRPRGIAGYAAELGITPTHLTRCCKQASGQSALGLLSDRRHVEACRLLRDTRLPLGRIAKASGYGSAAYFSRVFQGRTGQPPSHFRTANHDRSMSQSTHS